LICISTEALPRGAAMAKDKPFALENCTKWDDVAASIMDNGAQARKGASVWVG